MHPTASQLTSNASRGLALLNDPVSNKGTAFTSEERKRCGLEGLMPPSTNTLERQVERVLGHLDGKPNDLERYIYLVDLCDRNEILFYRTVISNCRRASFRSSRTGESPMAALPLATSIAAPAASTSAADMKGRIAEVLRNWPGRDVRFMCVSTGGRLRRGALGVNRDY